jgi:hypothetical protein
LIQTISKLVDNGMNERIVADILAAHADRLNQGQRGAAAQQGVSAELLPAVRPLMRLAERIQSALVPVQPDPAFVRRVGKQLVATSSGGRKAMNERTRKAVIIGAAALGSLVSVASAVGVVIYLVRHRGRVRPEQAVSGSAIR